MKFVSLLTAAHVAGQLRHPHEGVLHVEDDAAARLIADNAAVDVTEDFTAKANKTVPVDKIESGDAASEAAPPENPHQSEIAPQTGAPAVEDAPKPRRRAASQE
ncbi:hypothetical protein ASE90_01760 [Sphingomonas sp. Leaf67]|uniref:hypothetical protein n=1 Tax=Sphingomonas sp. Leaf67 TaxID=1736230 RepID=UPI0006F89A09|nr:hypothetical protein [Sphingomonas sp. Leaf67]KQN91557.1 hypothetical protein ASE90_01760 [Sphingomonas sp. Leaf67]